jgi:CDK inhibitor PHO81
MASFVIRLSSNHANAYQDLAPALIESIKTASLVLISDVSGSKYDPSAPREWGPARVPEGVDGTLKGNGVLHFNDSVDM